MHTMLLSMCNLVVLKKLYEEPDHHRDGPPARLLVSKQRYSSQRTRHSIAKQYLVMMHCNLPTCSTYFKLLLNSPVGAMGCREFLLSGTLLLTAEGAGV